MSNAVCPRARALLRASPLPHAGPAVGLGGIRTAVLWACLATSAVAQTRGDETEPVTLPKTSVKAPRESATGPVQGYVATRAATATKTDTPLAETPQSISVLTRDQLDDRGVDSVDTALRYSAGTLPMGYNYGGDWFSMRGFDIADEGVFVDGLRAFTNVFSSSIEPFGAERIEILRGPASVLYGMATPGGMVNIISKRPQAGQLRELGIELGSHHRRQLTADLGGSLDANGTALWRLVMLGRRADTQYDFARDNRLYIAPSLTWKPSAATSLTLLAAYHQDEQTYTWGSQFLRVGTAANGQPSAAQPLVQPALSFNYGGPGSGYERKASSAGWQVEHRVADNLMLRQNLRYAFMDTQRYEQWSSYFAQNLGLQSDGRTLNLLGVYRPDADRNLNIDQQVEAKLGTGSLHHTLLGGVDYRQVWFRSAIYTDGTVRALDMQQPVWTEPDWLAMKTTLSRNITRGRQTGFYLQDQMKLGERWAFSVGARRDRVHYDVENTSGRVTPQTWHANTGRAGVVYLARNGWSPYGSVSTSFEPTTGTNASGTPNQPSKGRQLELGTRWQPGDGRTNLLLALYHLEKTNVVLATTASDPFPPQAGKVRSRGAELEATASLRSGLDLQAAYTFTDTKITRSNSGDEGLAVIGKPRHAASLWTHAQVFPGLPLKAGLGVRYIGASRSYTAAMRNPAATAFDAAVSYPWGAWRLALNIDNVFDRIVLTDCAAFGTDNARCHVGWRRQVRARATYSF